MKKSGFATKAMVVSILPFGPAWPVIADEPVVGGPCQGCELVFVGMPGEIASEARIAPPKEPGEAMRIEGTVTSADGRTASAMAPPSNKSRRFLILDRI